MANETVLSISGLGVPPYSARGLQQSLEPISASVSQRRTINGTLIDLSLTQFQKYKSTITGNDQKPPACDGAWPGKIVTVECLAELCYIDGGAAQRSVVAGSSYSDGGYTYYRPTLTMVVVGFQYTQDEYNAGTQWTMDLEEQ